MDERENITNEETEAEEKNINAEMENTDTEEKPNETDFKLPNEKKNKEKKPKNPLPWKKIGIAAGIVIGICAAAYLGGAAYYNSHFYPGTNLGNFNCANLTVEQAKEKIENEKTHKKL